MSDVLKPSEKEISSKCLIVGIGGSAGGLEAFRELFRELSPDTGMAYVVVQHLDPKHQSALSEILERETQMPVREVKNSMLVDPNHVYIIPPNTDLSIVGGHFRLSARTLTKGRHTPIDCFLQSLATVKDSDAIAVILSGMGSDGSLGVQSIKAEGGITFAQDEKSAKFSQMPSHAIATGCVDFILSPAEIARELSRIGRHPLAGMKRASEKKDAEASGSDPFVEILKLIRKSSGVDFSHYKPNTLRRRIMKRMLLHRKEEIGDYIQLLEKDPKELRALHDDFLIKVTEFFRDPEVFEQLKTDVFPSILKNHVSDEAIRIWVAGCATGEEVYSIIIALWECLGERATHTAIQVFGTDISEWAIQKARSGIYSAESLQSLSQERLQLFFRKVDGDYQINKQIRDLCVFSVHNVAADPPFSKMDLISCRNLLIYLGPHLQKRVFPTFHYSLKSTGYLLLGSAESVGSFSDLFSLHDKKHKIFSKKVGTNRRRHEPSAGFNALERGSFSPPSTKAREFPDKALDIRKQAERVILSNYAPSGVVTNEDFEIIHSSGDTSPYLSLSSGLASLNLFKMTREGLVHELRRAVEIAQNSGRPERTKVLQLKHDGGHKYVTVEIVPIKPYPESERYFLILFRESEGVASTEPREKKKAEATATTEASKGQVDELKEELASSKESLKAARETLQATIENYEATTEELKSANEEILSSNEELQSTNEELETAKEELQSTNEELNTVNEELNNRNAELTHVNSDLVNVLAGSHVPIIIVGKDVTIRRYTPMAEKLLRLTKTDVGRSIDEVNLSIGASDLRSLVVDAIENLSSHEREVRDQKGVWYSLRIRPYKTVDDKIEGAVLTLIDIDAIKRGRDFANAIVQTVREPLVVLTRELRLVAANSAFYKTFHVSSEQSVNQLLYELGNRQWNIPGLRTLLDEVVAKNKNFESFEVMHNFPEIGPKTMLLNAHRIHLPGEESELVLLAIEDRTERKKWENALLDSETRLKLAVEAGNLGTWDLNPKTRTLLWSDRTKAISGLSDSDEVSYDTFLSCIHPDDKDRVQKTIEKAIAPESDGNYQIEYRTIGLRDQQERWSAARGKVFFNEKREAIRFVGTVSDITEQKRFQDQMVRTARELARSNEDLANFAHVASHDLQEPLRMVTSYLRLLEKQYGGKILEDKAAEFLSFAVDGAVRMKQLIEDLLNYARVGGSEIEFETVDIGSVMKNVLSNLKVAIEEARAQVTVGTLPLIRGNPREITQVFQNLIENSLKYRSESETPQVTVTAEEKEGVWLFCISDNGIGIDAARAKEIFEPFRRLQGRRDYPGTGLGLAICKKVIEQHGGGLWLHSAAAQGATFCFTLPIK